MRLGIDTSTDVRVGLADDGGLLAARAVTDSRAHAEQLMPLVNATLAEAGRTLSDVQAIVVGVGPGPFTGLRVGVSTAKGLCFGAGIPMISVGTLDTLVWQALDGNMLPEGCRYIIPMIDARRMEVYTGIFTPDGKQISPTVAQIIDADSFKDQLAEGPVLFIGDGADKCKDTLTSPNARFIQCCPKAASMMHPAIDALEAKRFEDVAYFEPFYLKEFITTVSKKKII